MDICGSRRPVMIGTLRSAIGTRGDRAFFPAAPFPGLCGDRRGDHGGESAGQRGEKAETAIRRGEEKEGRKVSRDRRNRDAVVRPPAPSRSGGIGTSTFRHPPCRRRFSAAPACRRRFPPVSPLADLSRAEPKRFRDGDQRRVATGRCHPIQLSDAAVRGRIGGVPGCPRRRPLGPGLDRSLPLCAPSRRHTDPRIRSGRKFAAMLKTVRDSPPPPGGPTRRVPGLSARRGAPDRELNCGPPSSGPPPVSSPIAEHKRGPAPATSAARGGTARRSPGGASPRRIWHSVSFGVVRSATVEHGSDGGGRDG